MIRITLLSFFAALLLVNCSKSSSSSTGVSDIASLPKGTAATTANSVIRGGDRLWLQSASNGIQLDTWYNSFNGQATKSQTFCQLGLMIKEVIRAASQPDKIACYMGVMATNATLSGWPSDGNDGNYHYVNITGTGGGDGKIKFKVNTSGGLITGFEMFSGFGAAYQTEYVAMTTSGSDVTLTSVQYYSGSRSQTSRGRVTVTGTVSSSGTWTSPKAIVAESTRAMSGGYNRTENARLELTQYSDRFQMSGYSAGTESSNAFTNQGYAVVQLLNPAPLSGLALGEGTAKMSMTYNGYSPFSATNAWNGDTGVPKTASTADYYSTVEAASLPTAPASYNTSFATAEQWDLTPPSGTTPTSINLTTLQNDATFAAQFAACNTNYGFSEDGGGSWPDCWALSDN